MANPWEMDWNAAKQSVSNKIDETVETVKSMLPWQQDWSGKKAIPPSQPSPVQPQKPVNIVDQVFESLIQAESGGKHVNAKGELITSKRGAEGITQLLPTTASNPGYGIEPAKDKSESEYRRVGKEYLQKMYEKFQNWEKALAAYNAGVGNVMKAEGKAERFGGDWKEYLPKKEETLPYIKKVLGDKLGFIENAATMYASASQPVNVAEMAGGKLGEKTLEKTGSPAAATAVDVATQLFTDPANLVPAGKAGAGLAGILKVFGGKKYTEVMSDATFAHILADITGKPETIKDVMKMGTLSADKKEEMLNAALKERTIKTKEK